LPDPQFLIDRLDITVVFTIVLTVFKSRVPWMVSNGRSHWEPLAGDQNCSHLGTAQHWQRRFAARQSLPAKAMPLRSSARFAN
jgi:hypothetical protein